MKKVWILMLVVVMTVGVLGLSGCTKKEPTPTTPAVKTQPPAEQPAANTEHPADDPAQAKPKDHPAHN